MHESEDTSEIWFERWGGTHLPITTKGFYVLLVHMIPLLLFWVLPLSLLAHFGVIAEAVVFWLATPVAAGCLISFVRVADRHSHPRR